LQQWKPTLLQKFVPSQLKQGQGTGRGMKLPSNNGSQNGLQSLLQQWKSALSQKSVPSQSKQAYESRWGRKLSNNNGSQNGRQPPQLLFSSHTAISWPSSSVSKSSVPERLSPTNPTLPWGLWNVGATCFANSAIQLLYAISKFKEAIMNSLSKHFLILVLQEMFGSLDSSGGMSSNRLEELWHIIFPLLNAISDEVFSLGKQSDTGEFIQGCFDILNGGEARNGADSQVTKCFRFEICNITQAKSDSSNHRKEIMPELMLRVELKSELIHALRSFGVREELTRDNQWAGNDGIKVDTVRYSRIKNPPQVLLVHIKRFERPADSPWVKNNQPMTIPITFDLPQEIMAKPSRIKYELIGGIVHSGTCKGGHYIAYIKTSNGFFEFNDSFVRRLSDTEASAILKSGAYILAYRRSN
jgi:ubiquitin C-terminal hydrolase